MLCHVRKASPKIWCCTAQRFLEYSSVPAPGSLLLRYRKYLQSNAAHLDPDLRDLLTKNRLEVLKNHKKVLKNSLSNATIEELPYLAYLTYKAYDRDIQELLSAQLNKIQNFDNLNFTEISIICNTMFVSKLSVSNLNLMINIASRLKKDIEKYGLHREQVSVVKLLRKMRFFDKSSVSVLLMQLNSEHHSLTLTDIVHFLAWIVDSEFFPSPLSVEIIERITAEIEKSGYLLRCKDIDRILWMLSFQHGVPTQLVDKLAKLVHSMKSHPDLTTLMFGNILLSFAILGRYDRALIDEFLSDNRITDIKKIGMDRSRQLSRLGLFLQAAKIEANYPKSLMQTLDETSAFIRAKGISEMDVSRELKFVRKDLTKLEQAAARR